MENFYFPLDKSFFVLYSLHRSPTNGCDDLIILVDHGRKITQVHDVLVAYAFIITAPYRLIESGEELFSI